MEIRQKIIYGAGELFISKGTRLVTMDTIAQHLGISKRTIYENFKDKNDLLYNFMNETISIHKLRALEIMNKSSNVIEALFSFGELNYGEMRKVNPLFIRDMKKYHPSVFKRVYDDGELRNYELSYTMLKRGLNEGIFSKEIDLEIANRFIHFMMEFVHKTENDHECDHLKIIKTVHLPYLKGISTEKGNQLIESFLEKYKKMEETNNEN